MVEIRIWSSAGFRQGAIGESGLIGSMLSLHGCPSDCSCLCFCSRANKPGPLCDSEWKYNDRYCLQNAVIKTLSLTLVSIRKRRNPRPRSTRFPRARSAEGRRNDDCWRSLAIGSKGSFGGFQLRIHSLHPLHDINLGYPTGFIRKS